jgi:hypothetical protein
MRDSATVAAVKDVRALAEIMTLVTLDEADIRMVALIDVSVTQASCARSRCAAEGLRIPVGDGQHARRISRRLKVNDPHGRQRAARATNSS